MVDRNRLFAIFAIIAILILSILLWPRFEATGRASQATITQVAVVGKVPANPCQDLGFWKCIRADECRWNWRNRICELRH